VIKAIESDNVTLHTLTIQGGPGKFWESSLENAFRGTMLLPLFADDDCVKYCLLFWLDRLCQNKSLMKVNIGPLRSTDVRNALDKMQKENKSKKRETVTVCGCSLHITSLIVHS
jgi:hypothetical protein